MSTEIEQEPVAPTQAAAEPSGELGRAFGNVLRQPGFLIVAGVLLVAAIGLNAAVNFMSLHFKKEPVQLAQELGTIPAHVANHWVQVAQDQPLDSEMQDVLGTTKYIFRDYLDENVVGVGVKDQYRLLQDKAAAETNPERKKTLEEAARKFIAEKRQKFPNGVVRLSITYYTGMVDTVAHVPDRCVTADGYEPTSYEEKEWRIGSNLPVPLKAGNGDDIRVRYINFENQTGAAANKCNISYFFSVNGQFACSPLDVRGKLADLWETKAYYAKIETMTMMEDSAQAERVQVEFLTAVMPDVIRCMPDWEKVHGRPSKVASAG